MGCCGNVNVRLILSSAVRGCCVGLYQQDMKWTRRHNSKFRTSWQPGAWIKALPSHLCRGYLFGRVGIYSLLRHDAPLGGRGQNCTDASATLHFCLCSSGLLRWAVRDNIAINLCRLATANILSSSVPSAHSPLCFSLNFWCGIEMLPCSFIWRHLEMYGNIRRHSEIQQISYYCPNFLHFSCCVFLCHVGTKDNSVFTLVWSGDFMECDGILCSDKT